MVARYGANAEHLALYAQDPKAVYLVRLAWVELTPFGAGWTSARDRLGALRRSCGRRSARGPRGRPSTSLTHSSPCVSNSRTSSRLCRRVMIFRRSELQLPF